MEGHAWILVAQDVFTKWVVAKPLRQATAVAITKNVKEHILLQHGCPRRIITDNGRQFESREFRGLLERAGIQHRRTPPYSPQCNPVERANRTLKTMVAQYIERDHRRWDQKLPELVFAINTAVQESTGFTPARLTYGRELTAPGTLRAQHEAPLAEDIGEPETATREHRINQMREEAATAAARQQDATSRQEQYYNLRRRDWRPAPGDRVMRREHPLSKAGEHFAGKLAPKYSGPYTVDRAISPVVYRLRDQNNRLVGTAHVKDLKGVADS
ncbi:PREDICTED: uncharacterized protein LOC105570782 [Vollenhovia emeryi]|uniref:uncharacterized protein LOC105570782 n=1 Tax=Vollenhovia emeryi TaxID=411798 RepID=UPI0005F3B1AD|nr:PREDICTED: uncharacterized protein LOC105570782 [Vollenhovia emeryi]